MPEYFSSHAGTAGKSIAQVIEFLLTERLAGRLSSFPSRGLLIVRRVKYYMTFDMRLKARVTRIGNSLGILIPSEEAKRHGIVAGDSVEIEVEKRSNMRELFGSVSFSKSSQELKDEAREGWRD
jgi:antitoxin component of MazEF toxin-antitoxin module